MDRLEETISREYIPSYLHREVSRVVNSHLEQGTTNHSLLTNTMRERLTRLGVIAQSGTLCSKWQKRANQVKGCSPAEIQERFFGTSPVSENTLEILDKAVAGRPVEYTINGDGVVQTVVLITTDSFDRQSESTPMLPPGDLSSWVSNTLSSWGI